MPRPFRRARYAGRRSAANITIASLHAFLHAETVVVREELTVGGTVVSSDEAGNFYRTLVLDDGTGGAELRIAEYNLYTICPSAAA